MREHKLSAQKSYTTQHTHTYYDRTIRARAIMIGMCASAPCLHYMLHMCGMCLCVGRARSVIYHRLCI